MASFPDTKAAPGPRRLGWTALGELAQYLAELEVRIGYARNHHEKPAGRHC